MTMRLRPKKLIAPAVVVALIVLVALAMSGGSVEVDVASVRTGRVRDTVEEEARTKVVDPYVLSSPVAGRLLRVTVREGQEVEKDEVLATIDRLALDSRLTGARAKLEELRQRVAGVDRRRPKDEEMKRAAYREALAREELTVAEAALNEAVAARAKAVEDAKRARELRGSGTITPAELEGAELTETRAVEDHGIQQRRVTMARLGLEVAKLETSILAATRGDFDWEEKAYRAQIEAAEAELTVLEDDAKRAELSSPIDGVVLRRFQESETVVAAGTPILEVGDVRRLVVEADVLSEDAARMKEGQPVEVFGRALGGETIPGTITRIHGGAFRKISSLGVEQQRVTVVASFDPGERRLGDGFRVHLRVIFEEKRDVLLVPEGALFRRSGRWSVFRVVDGKAVLTPVRTGLGDGLDREVREGLSDGDEVILHPGNGLEDGARVEAR
jgi:HlyD family secretion protein